MAIGDAALAAGFDIVDPTDFVIDGDEAINHTRDLLAIHRPAFRTLRSKLIVPGAPFQRALYSSPPTVTVNTTAAAAYSGGRVATITPTSPYMTLTAAGDWGQNGSSPFGWSPAHIYPNTDPGRQYNRVIFGYDGAKFALEVISAPGHRYRVKVNGQYFATSSVAGTGGGADRWLTIDFTTAANRIIEIENTGADLVSIIYSPTGTIWAVPPRGPRCIVMGDSYVGGSGSPSTGYSTIDAWPTAMADVLGWQNVWNSGYGGSGYIAGGAQNFGGRAAVDVIAHDPDVVIVMGGRNDYGSGAAAVGAAAGALFTALRAGLPDALLVIVGPNGSASPVAGTSDTTWQPFQDAMFAATLGIADLQLDYSSSGIFTGSGKVGTTTGSGNGDQYIQSDGVHPSTTGAIYLGERIGQKLLAALATV